MVKNKGINWTENISSREQSSIAPGNTDVVDFETIFSISDLVGAYVGDGNKPRFNKCILHGSGYLNASSIGALAAMPKMKIYSLVTPTSATVTGGNYSRGSVTSILDSAVNTVFSYQHIRDVSFGKPQAANATVNSWNMPIQFKIDLTKLANVIAAKVSETPDVDLKVRIVAIYLDDARLLMTGLMTCHVESKLVIEQRNFSGLK